MDDMAVVGAPDDAGPSRPAVKRTYGRRRDPAPDTSIVDSTIPTSASSRASSNEPPSLEPSHEYPPTSDGLDASASSPASFGDADASNEDNDGTDALSSRYEFDWKKRLRELDEDHEPVHKTVKDASGERALDSEVASSPQPSSPTGDAQRTETRGIGGSSNAIPNKIGGSDDSPVASRSPSPVVRRRQPNRKSLMPAADSGTKAKGKQRAVAKESDAEYASDDDGSGHTKRRRRSEGKGKQKRPPTRKEQEETQKATARMMAERDATLPRVQVQQYGLKHFLEQMQKHAVPAPKEVKPVEIPASDPIQQFSSSPSSRIPTEHSQVPSRARSVSLKPFARTPSPVVGASFEPNGLLGHTAVDGDRSSDSSEDEEMPDVGSLIYEEAKKRGEREKLLQLAELKRRALEQQKRLTVADDDDDDGLEIVHEDMQAVARDEAQARRADAAHGVRRSIGRNAQLALAGVPRRKSGVAGPPTLAAAAAPNFQRRKTHDGADGQLTADQLNRVLRQRAEEQKAAEIRQKEEQWKKAGGRLKTRPADAAPSDFKSAVAEFVQKRLAEAQIGDEINGEYEYEDEEDPDYQPAGDNDQVASSEEANSDAENQQVLPSLTELVHGSDNDDENVAPAPRGRRAHPRRALVALDSDDEEGQPSDPLGRVLVADSSFAFPGPQHPPQSLLRRRASTSSLEYYTENGTDKENDVSLMYDRGEDKENTVVASQSSGFSRAGSFFSQSQGRPLLLDDDLPMESTPQDGRRAPFQELPTGDDDENPFSFSSDLRSPARRLTFSPGPPLPPVQSDENAPVQVNPTSPPAIRPVSLKGGLADLFESQASNKATSLAVAPRVIQDGGLSDFFSQQSALDGPAQIKGARTSQDLALTADITLQPALDINQTLRRKADDIFEKEQEIIAEGANKETSPEKKRIYVNEHGFLTQTRPMWTPARSQLFSPSQLAKRTPILVPDVFSPRPATRHPLATIDALMTNNDDDDDDFDAQPRTRLKRRKISPEKSVPSGSRGGSVSPSPSPHKLRDAFAIMRQASVHPKKALALMGQKGKKSEFIEGEAEESDDDDRRGFGLRKRDDEEEEDDETQDQTLQELVDDQEMDETVLAEDAVLEKHREHLEQDDQDNEKLHQDAIQGKLRLTRRNRGVGFEDDDSDDDDDEAARARRRLQRQKRKIDGDTLDDLAKNPETAPFALAYQDHMVEDEVFVHEEHNDDTLVGSQGMDVDGSGEGEEGEEQEVISAVKLREQLRAAARQKEHVQSLNPHDVSWVDNDEHEEENALLVKEWSGTSKKVSLRKDGDWDPSMQASAGRVRFCSLPYLFSRGQPKTDLENERDRVRMEKWAKTETRVYGTGRTTASVSVTGGGKKRGGIASRGSGRMAAHGPKQTNKVAKTPSILSTMSTSRREKFQD
ncbi:hypothetical protein EVJ58_g5980 [Rhodofomes roseus]|uniref:DNA replication checkpoint mediator MRC1 domain-containing protein n=1 Tax=Rhodofomes roseus TaxID=34475 RepID=A0A4Y9Y986_9APHY|nr:hypothetical protein EVJ58_g5980 [Rhodofomes roseus]